MTDVEGSSTLFTRTAGNCAAGLQNKRVISVGYGMCYRTSQKCRVLWHDRHRTHRSVRVLYTEPEGNLCGVSDVLQNLTEV